MAFQNLLNLEINLRRDDELADDFCQQVEDMVTRGAAVIMSEEQLADWKGDLLLSTDRSCEGIEEMAPVMLRCCS